MRNSLLDGAAGRLDLPGIHLLVGLELPFLAMQVQVALQVLVA